MEAIVSFVLQTSLAIVLAAIRLAFVLGAIVGQVIRALIPYIMRGAARLARGLLRLLSKASTLDASGTRSESTLQQFEHDRKVAQISRHDETRPSQKGRRRNAAKVYW